MSKITKKDLNERLLMVETLLGLHRALPEQISNDQANNAIFRMQCALSSGKELAERNPTEVEQRIEALEEFATYADNMLTELNHALPDPEYDAKCEAQEADIDASLDRHRERLGLNKLELTGSDYYHSKSVTERLENGRKLIMCFVSNVSESDAIQERHVEVITSVDAEFNDADGYGWQYAVPINNKGEPLTAAEVGL